MPTEFHEYEGSPLEARDLQKEVAAESSPAASAARFEDGTGLPLVDPAAWDGFSDDGSGEFDAEYQDDSGFEGEAYDAPAEPTSLLEAARAEVQGLSPDEVAVVVETWPEAVQQAIAQEAAAEQQRAQSDASANRLASTFEQRSAWSEQQAQAAEQQYADAETVGHSRGLQMIDALAADAHTRVDAEAILAQAEQALGEVAAQWRQVGASEQQLAELYDPTTIGAVFEELVGEQAAADRHRQMLLDTRTGLGPYPLGPYPTGSWVRPT